MLINTHMLMAEDLYKSIKDITNIDICRNSFIYGNVKPDIVYRLSSLPHKIDELIDPICEDMEGIISTKFRSDQQLSVDLGVICHFLCDFFCGPHFYADMSNHIVSHLNYEKNLHRFYRDANKDTWIDELRLFEGDKTHNYDSFKQCILRVKDLYTREEASYERDIYFALLASKVIMRAVLKELDLNISLRVSA